MRIIKEGTLPKNRVYRGTCSNCGAVVEGQGHEGHPKGQAGSRIACPTDLCPATIDGVEPALPVEPITIQIDTPFKIEPTQGRDWWGDKMVGQVTLDTAGSPG